jgi:hypothetical protein
VSTTPTPTAPRTDPTGHEWVAAAAVDLDPADAAPAAQTGILARGGDEKVWVLDVYCGRCRRGHDDAAGHPCEPAQD